MIQIVRGFEVMAKLPLRPILFIFLYLGSLVVPFYLAQHNVTHTVNLAALGVAFALLLQLVWTHQAATFISKVSHTGTAASAWTRGLLGLFGLVVVYVLLYDNYIKPAISGTVIAPFLDRESPILGALFIVPVLIGFWLTARAVCDAEEKGHVPAHSVVGTFLLFFYLIIGAPFIYRRLKVLTGRKIVLGAAYDGTTPN
jgi:hypothetical protein